MRLAEKVMIVTGGASGMGLDTVMKFMAEGAKVVIADFNEQTGAAAVADGTAKGFDVSFIKTDVANEHDIETMCEHALTTYGRLDALFNNAGVGGAIGPLTETTVEDWDYTFDVLAKGVFLGTKHAARIMRVARELAAPSSIRPRLRVSVVMQVRWSFSGQSCG